MAKDVNIENGTIVASRFMLQAKELSATRPPTDLVRNVREIVDKYPYKIAIYHPNFIYSDLVNFPLLLPIVCQTKHYQLLICLDYSAAISDDAMCSWGCWSNVSGLLNIHSKSTLLFVGDIFNCINHVWCYGIHEPFGSRP